MWKWMACNSRTEETEVSVLIRRGNFIYNTWCWQGVSISASILQGWSARLHVLYGIWKPRLQWHYKHTLETTDSFFSFFCYFSLIFLQNGTNNNTKYLCCWHFTKKVVRLDNCAIIFFCFFLLRLKLCKYDTPESLLDCSLGHAGCDTF